MFVRFEKPIIELENFKKIFDDDSIEKLNA